MGPTIFILPISVILLGLVLWYIILPLFRWGVNFARKLDDRLQDVFDDSEGLSELETRLLELRAEKENLEQTLDATKEVVKLDAEIAKLSTKINNIKNNK